jgi:hypothetical protein
MKKHVLLLTALLLLLFSLKGISGAEEYQLKKYELAVGGGTSINALSTKQVMLFAARNFRVERNLFLRVEPTLEYIMDSEDMFVAGGSLVLRFASPHKGVTPFVDLGAGANYASRKIFENRDLGSNFLFNLILGGGINLGHDYSLSVRYRHLSNAGLAEYNGGFDSLYLLFGIYIK